MGNIMRQLPTMLHGSESQQKISSKRVITFLLAVTYVLVVMSHLYFDFEIAENIYDGLVDVLIWSLGFVGSEQFAKALNSRKNKIVNQGEQ